MEKSEEHIKGYYSLFKADEEGTVMVPHLDSLDPSPSYGFSQSSASPGTLLSHPRHSMH